MAITLELKLCLSNSSRGIERQTDQMISCLQTLPALFIGPFEHVERYRNLKFVVRRITNIQGTVLRDVLLEITKNHLEGYQGYEYYLNFHGSS